VKVRNVQRHGEEKVELQMTPMIDIVFQLLIFFIMTFKIASLEGDFSITMPQAPSEGQPDPTQLPPIVVRMQANQQGELVSVQLNAKTLGQKYPFEQLRNEIRAIIGDERGPGSAETEVELDCDYNLKYAYVIEAITAVSGYRIEGTDQINPLVEKIRFSRLRKPSG